MAGSPSGNTGRITITASLDDKLSAGLASLQNLINSLVDVIKAQKAATDATNRVIHDYKKATDAAKNAAEQEKTALLAKIAALKGNTAEAQKHIQTLLDQQRATLAAATGDEELAKEIINLREEFKRLEAEERRQNKALEKQAEVAKKGKDALKDIAATVGVALAAMGTAALGAFGIAIHAAVDFDSAMANVSTLVDTSVVDMDQLRQAILQLPPSLGSATEMAKGLYTVLSANITEPKAALEVLAQAAKFAKANLADMGASIDFVTTVLNAYKLKASEAERVTDIFTRTIMVGKITGEELAHSIGMVIPVAATLKVPLEEVGAALAVMTLQGIQTDHAVVSLDRVLNSFLSPVERAKELAGDLGIELSATTIQSQGLRGAITNLAKRISEMNAGPLRDEAISIFFGSAQSLRGILALTGEQAEIFDKILGDLQNSAGSTTIAFDKQEEATKKLFKTMLNNLVSLAINIGSIFLPAINDIITHLSNVVSWFRGMDASTQTIIAVLGLAAGGLMAFAGVFLLLLPRIISTITAVRDFSTWIGTYSTTTAAATAATGGLTTATQASTAAFLANPIIAIAGLLLMLEVNFNLVSGAAFYLVEGVKAAWEWMGNLIARIGEEISQTPILGSTLRAATGVLDQWNTSVTNASTGVGEFTEAQNRGISVAELRRQKDIEQKQAIDDMQASLQQMNHLQREHIQTQSDATTSTQTLTDAQRQAQAAIQQEITAMHDKILKLQGSKFAQDDMTLSALAAKLESKELAQKYLEEKQKLETLENQVKTAKAAEEARNRVKKEQKDAQDQAKESLEQERLEMALSIATLQDDKAAIEAAKKALDEHSITLLAAKLGSESLARAIIEEKNQNKALEDQVKATTDAEKLLDDIKRGQPDIHKDANDKIYDDYIEVADKIKVIETTLGEQHASVLAIKQANEEAFNKQILASKQEFASQVATILDSAKTQELAIDAARVAAIISNNAATLDDRVAMLQAYIDQVSTSKTTLEGLEKEIHDNTITLAQDEWEKKVDAVNRWYNDTTAKIEDAVRQEKITRDAANALITKAESAKWSQIQQIESDYDKEHRTIIDSLRDAWEDYSNETVSITNAAYNAFKGILSAAGTFFKEAFVAVITLDFARLADAFKNFAESIFKEFSNLIARIIAEWAIANLGIKTAILAILNWIKEIFTSTNDEIGKTVPAFTSAIIEGMLPAVATLALVWMGFNAQLAQSNDLLASMNAGGTGGGIGGMIQNIGGLVSGINNMGGGLGNISGILQKIPWGAVAKLGAVAVPLAGAGLGFVGGSLLGKAFGLGPRGQNIMGGAAAGGIGTGLALMALTSLGPLGVGIGAILGAIAGGSIGSLFGGKKKPPRRGFVLGTQFQGLVPGIDDLFNVGKIDVFAKAIKRLPVDAVNGITDALEHTLKVMTTLWGATFNRFPEDIRRSLVDEVKAANKKIRKVYEEIIFITRGSIDPFVEDLLQNAPSTVTKRYREVLRIGVREWLKQILDTTDEKFRSIFTRGSITNPELFQRFVFFQEISETLDTFIKQVSNMAPGKRGIAAINEMLTTFETFVRAGDLFSQQDISNLFGAFRDVVDTSTNLPVNQARDALMEFNQLLESAIAFQAAQQAIIDAAPMSEFTQSLRELREQFAADEQTASDLYLTLNRLHEAQGIQLRDLIGITEMEEELAARTTSPLEQAIQAIEAWWTDIEERAAAIAQGVSEGLLTPGDMDQFLVVVEGLREIKLGDLADEFLRPLEEQLSTLTDEALPAYQDFFAALNTQMDDLLALPVDWMAQFEADLAAIDGAAIEDALDVANRAIQDITEWLGQMGEFASIADAAARRILEFQLSTLKGVQARIAELTGATVTDAATAIDAIRGLLEAAQGATLEERADLLAALEESLRLAEDLSEAERREQERVIEEWAQSQRDAIASDAANRNALLQAISNQETARLDALNAQGHQDTEAIIAIWRELQGVAQAAEKEAQRIAIEKMEEVRAAIERQQVALEERLSEVRAAVDAERAAVAGAIAALEANLIAALHEVAMSFQDVLNPPLPPLPLPPHGVFAQHGIDYVPRDDFLVRAHKGEAIITAWGNEALAQMASGGLRYVPLEPARGGGGGSLEPAAGTGNGDALADKVARAVARAVGENAVNVTVQIEPAPVILDGRQISEVTLNVIREQGEAGRRMIPEKAIYRQ